DGSSESDRCKDSSMAKPIKGDASAKVSSGPEPGWLAGWVIALDGSLSAHPTLSPEGRGSGLAPPSRRRWPVTEPVPSPLWERTRGEGLSTPRLRARIRQSAQGRESREPGVARQ